MSVSALFQVPQKHYFSLSSCRVQLLLYCICLLSLFCFLVFRLFFRNFISVIYPLVLCPVLAIFNRESFHHSLCLFCWHLMPTFVFPLHLFSLHSVGFNPTSPLPLLFHHLASRLHFCSRLSPWLSPFHSSPFLYCSCILLVLCLYCTCIVAPSCVVNFVSCARDF